MTDLVTFHLPESVTGGPTDVDMAHKMIRAWRTDGIFQVALNAAQNGKTERALAASRRFFKMPHEFKSQCISDLTYSGYIASGEEVTAGEADCSEIFTVCKDLPRDSTRVRAQWP